MALDAIRKDHTYILSVIWRISVAQCPLNSPHSSRQNHERSSFVGSDESSEQMCWCEIVFDRWPMIKLSWSLRTWLTIEAFWVRLCTDMDDQGKDHSEKREQSGDEG